MNKISLNSEALLMLAMLLRKSFLVLTQIMSSHNLIFFITSLFQSQEKNPLVFNYVTKVCVCVYIPSFLLLANSSVILIFGLQVCSNVNKATTAGKWFHLWLILLWGKTAFVAAKQCTRTLFSNLRNNKASGKEAVSHILTLCLYSNFSEPIQFKNSQIFVLCIRILK